MISVITLSFFALDYTKKFVQSIRQNTQMDYELIIVDNGSDPETQNWVKTAADRSLIFSENKGFAGGFNAGLALASGEYVIFANNDTEFPPNWDIQLTETMKSRPDCGILTPAYTSGRKSARRKKAGKRIIKIPAFGKYPSGVAFMMKTGFMRQIGGWDEAYKVASGEDADLCFTVWNSGYEIYVDERVLILHEGKVSSPLAFENWRVHFKQNSRQFKKKWHFEYKYPLLARLKRRMRSAD